MIGFFLDLFGQTLLIDIFSWVGRLWFLWLPLLLAYLCWQSWLNRIKAAYLKKIEWTLLKIRIPREVFKGPRAMEIVLSSLYSIYKGKWIDRNIKGFLPHWYSLEIVGINGQVNFFVYCPKAFKNILESQIYSQYPDIEIVEAEDYTMMGNFENLNEWNIWGVEMELIKADAYPIRTYSDFGLHESAVKEEQKTNPLVSLLEFMGSLKQGEEAWMQIMIRGAGKEWPEAGKKVIDELMGRNKKLAEGERLNPLSKGEMEVVSAIERNIAKLGFETGVRIMYIAKKDIFNGVNSAAFTGLMNQYNAQNLNGFKPGKKKTGAGRLGFIMKVQREAKSKLKMLDAYRKRSYFYAPYRRQPFVFNTEELATIYHFPGGVAETPTFHRVETKKSEPPSTLPI